MLDSKDRVIYGHAIHSQQIASEIQDAQLLILNAMLDSEDRVTSGHAIHSQQIASENSSCTADIHSKD